MGLSGILFCGILPISWIIELNAQEVVPQEVSPPLTASGLGEPIMKSGYTEAPPPLHGPMWTPDGEIFYDHGDPTPFEQMMMDRVNRARANPGAEANRLGIGLNDGLSPGTIVDTPKQPLAMHRFLINAARDHAQWMLDENEFSHTGAGGSSISERISGSGYPLTGSWTVGENIAWNGTTGALDPVFSTQLAHDGLFESPGHRVNLMNNAFQEIGIGIRTGIFTDDGIDYNALMAAQKFAASGGTPDPFLLGTAYYDFNGNGLYDVEEAIRGVTVAISGGDYYTETASAGGYAMPMPSGAATRTVSFSAQGTTFTETVHLPGGQNMQVDLIPTYTPPELSGPTLAVTHHSHCYTPSSVFGATHFEVAVETRNTTPTDSPTDLSRMIDGTSPGYTPLSTTVKHTGTAAYHLTHPLSAFSSERLTYQQPFFVAPNAELRFYSRLQWASADQIACVEVSENEGATWQVVYAQAGENSSGEPSFVQRTVSLSDFEGATIVLRFNYDFAGGSLYVGTEDYLGWFIDEVEFDGLLTVETIESDTILPGDSYCFTPVTEQTYWIQARPLHHGTPWPGGPRLEITGVAPATFADWAATHELAAGLPAGTISDYPTADYSNDGIANLMAYALDIDPTQPIAAGIIPDPFLENGQWVYSYRRHVTATDVTVYPQISIDLENWFSPEDPDHPVTFTDTLSQQDGPVEHRQLMIDPASHRIVFVRLVAVAQ